METSAVDEPETRECPRCGEELSEERFAEDRLCIRCGTTVLRSRQPDSRFPHHARLALPSVMFLGVAAAGLHRNGGRVLEGLPLAVCVALVMLSPLALYVWSRDRLGFRDPSVSKTLLWAGVGLLLNAVACGAGYWALLLLL